MKKYFTKAELVILISSLGFILISFLLFDRSNYLTLCASLLGAVSLIFCSKGNPLGQFLIIIFGLIYAYISFSYSYYGEVITYLGMTAPMAVVSLVSWIKNPYKGNKSEVEVNSIGRAEFCFMLLLTAVVTVVFYYVLKFFGTANLIPSTISIITSFSAVYLTFRRSMYYAVAYALNDLVLIVLWIMASFEDASYISVTVCFITFFVNDIYGFINWRRMKIRQETGGVSND